MSFKSRWLTDHLRCPACLTTALAATPDDGAVCTACGVAYPNARTARNFITPDIRAQFRIEDNPKASDHPYNPSASRLIAECERVGGMALDCGAGSRLFTSGHLVQAEIMPYDNIDVVCVAQNLPFVDGAFDVIFSFDVLEHVNDPVASARELARVLKPGGKLYIDLPFLQVEHGYPHHYFNATRMGLRQLFDAYLSIEAHVVPQSGHPAHLVWMALQTFRNGLPKAQRARFADLTVGELLDAPWKALREDFGGSLGVDAMWKMASATQALFVKEAVADEPRSAIAITPDDLPNFAHNRTMRV